MCVHEGMLGFCWLLLIICLHVGTEGGQSGSPGDKEHAGGSAGFVKSSI